MSMPSKKILLVGLCGLLLAGCATQTEITKTISDSRSNVEAAIAQQNLMRKSGAVVRMSGAKLAGDEVRVKNASELPPVFSRPFNYLSAHQPLSAILGEIGRRTGVATAIQPSDPTGAVVGTASVAAVPGLPNSSGGPDTPIALDWSGDLKGLLDYLATTTRMFWKFEDGRIYFFKTETRSFHVLLPAGKRTVKSSISLSGAGGGGGASSGPSGSSTGTVDVASNMDIDAYDAMIKSVQAIVSTAEGAQPIAAGATNTGSKNVVANPSLGLITVTATPAILDRVASYVRSVNERFAQNVMIGVKIYSLTVKKGVNVGASLKLAYQDLANKYVKGTMTGAPNLTPAAGSTPGTMVIDAVLDSSWSGSLLLQALEQVGDVQYVTSGQVIAANGQPSPMQVATDFTYVASRATLVSPINGLATTTVTPGTRTVGFTANFLPLILGDNRIMLQYQLNLSSMLSLDTFGVGDSAVQLPNVATQSLQQQAYLKDGQSIVLLGFEQERATLDRAHGLSGISQNAGSERNMMVIVMEVFSGK